tara:strand:+ start:425 stop:1111 length:687 start_codon:yes stop_codon:yes gene_type:complete
MKLGIILTPDNRSKAYIQKLVKNNITLNSILFMNDNKREKSYSEDIIKISKKNGFDISKSVKDTLTGNDLTFKEFNFVDINHQDLVKHIENNEEGFLIFTGGGILKKEILNSGVKFIHFHPGIVPNYRGSTCFYYSILNEENCGVTAYIMDEKLDTGDIIYQKKFNKPDHIFVDEVYDPFIRSETLVELIKKDILQKNNHKKQDPLEGETFFIIHPVLKHISILNCVS